ncbi:LOW QUALITY PROTEIN: hypothetical protein LZ30DRAFT_754376 [Colletotrichum cereale]|nr:LOW QUALITY PROTEIN: hypothetical protein LZ30DRAFT_754376 [Colletotrichum cereale]
MYLFGRVLRYVIGDLLFPSAVLAITKDNVDAPPTLFTTILPGAYKDTCQRTAIIGLRGISKTQVPAVDTSMFKNACRAIGRMLNIRGINDKQADVKSLVKTALERDDVGDWLLIIDNADDIDLLFTSLKLMTDAQSITQLLEHLTYLPLAIRQASAYMACNKSVTVSKYLKYCKASSERLLISFMHILRDDLLAAKYLSFMCYLAEKDIPRALLPPKGDRIDTDDKIETDEAISTLMAYVFILKRDAVDRFDIHRLVRLVMRNWLREEKEQVTETIYWLHKRFPWPDYGNREVWMAYLLHANKLLRKYEELKLKVLGLENPDTLSRKYKEIEQILEHPNTLSSINNLALMLNS